MRKQIPSILFLLALAAAILLFATGNVLPGTLCVLVALALCVATFRRMRQEGRLPSSES